MRSPPLSSSIGDWPRLADPRYPTPIAAELADDVLDRFLRYVQVDTQSDDDSETYPSTAKQLDLGKMLADELRQIGLEDVELTEHGYVFATLPGSAGPTVGLIAHMDTSSDESGTNVKPQVIRNYDGGDIVLPGDPRKVLRAERESDPRRAGGPRHRHDRRHDAARRGRQGRRRRDHGRGRLPRGASGDRARSHPRRLHRRRGSGARGHHFDIEQFGADFAYTLDGSEIGRIDDETFSASEVRIRIEGHSVHPGTSKGKMVNAIKLASRIVERLPQNERSPETTEGREGFVHPTRIAGTTAEAEVRFIARDFDAQKLEEHEQLLRSLADDIAAEEPRAHVTVTVEESYRNMKEFLDADPAVTEAADEAARRTGMDPWREPIRGGTDGSMLSARGLLTPNIFTGGAPVPLRAGVGVSSGNGGVGRDDRGAREALGGA